MIVILESTSELNKIEQKTLAKAHLVLLRNHEQNDFSILKNKYPFRPRDIQKCTLAIDLLDEVSHGEDNTTTDKLAKEFLKM